MKYAGMPMGMCVLMKELGLYDLTPALCHLDYTMSEAGCDKFCAAVHPCLRRTLL